MEIQTILENRKWKIEMENRNGKCVILFCDHTCNVVFAKTLWGAYSQCCAYILETIYVGVCGCVCGCERGCA